MGEMATNHTIKLISWKSIRRYKSARQGTESGGVGTQPPKQGVVESELVMYIGEIIPGKRTVYAKVLRWEGPGGRI